MAGFLDKNTRIIDMVLTGEGRFLLSRGDLNYVYWSAFDDEIDYSPFISGSASMSDAQYSSSFFSSIEDSPVREVTTGYRRTNLSGTDFTNVHRPMFTIPQGQTTLPRMKLLEGPFSGTLDISIKQRKVVDMYVNKDDTTGETIQSIGPVDRYVERFASSVGMFEFGYSKDGFPVNHKLDGFLINVFQSGAEGLIEVGQKYDLLNESCYNNDLKIFAGGTAAVADLEVSNGKIVKRG